MFSAIVLVCVSNMKTPSHCYTYTNEVLHLSYDECDRTTREAIDSNMFYYFDEMRNEVHVVKDYYCVNWKAERV